MSEWSWKRKVAECRSKEKSKIRTELEKEIEEATNVEGNVGDELAVLPISLHCDPYVHSVRDTSSPRHGLRRLPLFSGERERERERERRGDLTADEQDDGVVGVEYGFAFYTLESSK